MLPEPAVKTPDLWLVPPQPNAHSQRVNPELAEILTPRSGVGHCLPGLDYKLCLLSLEGSQATFIYPETVIRGDFKEPLDKVDVAIDLINYLSHLLGRPIDTLSRVDAGTDAAPGIQTAVFTNLTPEEIAALNALSLFEGYQDNQPISLLGETATVIAISPSGQITLSLSPATSPPAALEVIKKRLGADPAAPALPSLVKVGWHDPTNPENDLYVITLSKEQVDQFTSYQEVPRSVDPLALTAALLLALGLLKLGLSHPHHRPPHSSASRREASPKTPVSNSRLTQPALHSPHTIAPPSPDSLASKLAQLRQLLESHDSPPTSPPPPAPPQRPQSPVPGQTPRIGARPDAAPGDFRDQQLIDFGRAENILHGLSPPPPANRSQPPQP